ncbi:MAG: NADH-quinone oxidoreductase subunit NuoH [Thermoproteota archaeon]|nr:MAG: NADH-quinone oxidoreductase subunit NuoH [Candidatus Korarchaeota archaeon]
MSVSELIRWIVSLLLKPYVFAPIFFPGIATAFILILLLIWLERKIAAKVQLRYGPLYVSKRFGGILQLVADLLRYLFQEPIIPKNADKIVFILGPILLFGTAYIPTALIPVSGSFVPFRSEVSLLVVIALLSISPLFDLVIGWASNNKFSLIGGLREGYIIVSYEIPLFISTIAIAMLYGTLDLVEIAGQNKWGVLLNPIAALVFLIVTYMSTARFPFEIAEAESEIVMGPYTEYSGILYGLTMGASYVKMYVLSLLFTILFLGGWNPVFWPFTLHPILPGLIMLAKALVVMVIGIFLRAVYPRYRIDHALSIGWKLLLTLSFLAVCYSLLITYLQVVVWV